MSAEPPVQYVSDENGNAVAVIVPIDVWREIESERETAYLLKSDAMRKRLLEAKDRIGGSRLTKPGRSLEFDPAAFDDLAWWVKQDRKKALRIFRLVLDTASDPFGGIGKPEPLKRDLAGCWSKRIDDEHRLVYQVLEDKIRILACRYHY